MTRFIFDKQIDVIDAVRFASYREDVATVIQNEISKTSPLEIFPREISTDCITHSMNPSIEYLTFILGELHIQTCTKRDVC